MAKKGKIVLLFISLVVILAIFWPGYNKLQRLRAKNADLRKRIEELKLSSAELEQEMVRFKTDPIYMEKVVRDQLGVVKEGEIIYKLLPPGKEREQEN